MYFFLSSAKATSYFLILFSSIIIHIIPHAYSLRNITKRRKPSTCPEFPHFCPFSLTPNISPIFTIAF